jgi:PhoD-like phosphatase
MSFGRLSPESLIGGPILRRSEPRRVCVWIATDVDVTVRGEILPARLARAAGPGPRGREDLLGEGESSSLRLGANLYITLIEIRPIQRTARGVRSSGNAQPAAFPTDELLAYDLAIRLRDANPRTEKRLVAFFPKERPINDPDFGIAYEEARLPTFYLPSGNPDKGQPNILYGSCRKLGGEGGDAFGFADHVLEQNAAIPGLDGKSANLGKRPSVLFLMGDQIYADDVAEPLLYHLMKRAFDLMGYYEEVPTRNGSVKARHPGSYSLWRPHLQTLLTSDDDACWRHLLSFGEFAAMYLLAWHPAHWPEEWKLPGGKPVNAAVADILNAARAEVPRIRRALANVPTYMIFDDHEVTDDWNFNEAWQDKVQKKSELGRRLVTNALAAYWAFQAWGNDPDQFEDLKEIVPRGLASLRDDDRGSALEAALLRKRQWSFVSPTWPQAIFLDTRTHRDLAPKPGARLPSTQSPRLLDDETMKGFQQDADVQSIAPDAILLVVAPSPIFNVRFSELMLSDLAVIKSSEFSDLELWMDNPGGYIDMVRTLARSQAKLCIILSGDVHYMFAQRAALFENGTPVSPPILQFTSSAFQNLHTKLFERLVDWLRSHNATLQNLGLFPHVPKVTDVHSEHRGLRLEIEMLHGASLIDRPKAPGHDEVMFKESNIGQLEIAGGVIQNTFWRRRLNERRKPGALPDPDSPVVRVRYR